MDTLTSQYMLEAMVKKRQYDVISIEYFPQKTRVQITKRKSEKNCLPETTKITHPLGNLLNNLKKCEFEQNKHKQIIQTEFVIGIVERNKTYYGEKIICK